MYSCGNKQQLEGASRETKVVGWPEAGAGGSPEASTGKGEKPLSSGKLVTREPGRYNG